MLQAKADVDGGSSASVAGWRLRTATAKWCACWRRTRRTYALPQARVCVGSTPAYTAAKGEYCDAITVLVRQGGRAQGRERRL
jgi:hypothetical protein